MEVTPGFESANPGVTQVYQMPESVAPQWFPRFLNFSLYQQIPPNFNPIRLKIRLNFRATQGMPAFMQP
jgi:hypothetical protein